MSSSKHASVGHANFGTVPLVVVLIIIVAIVLSLSKYDSKNNSVHQP